MKAGRFEYKYRAVLHFGLLGASVLTYLIDRDDVVWRFVKEQPDSAMLERLFFALGTALIFGSAAIETRAWLRWRPALISGRPQRGHLVAPLHCEQPFYVARLLLSYAVALLLPLSGALLFVVGETLLVLRLLGSEARISPPAAQQPSRAGNSPAQAAFRNAASKWGLALTMVVFTWTMRDRIAEVGAALSFLVWLVLNLPGKRWSNS